MKGEREREKKEEKKNSLGSLPPKKKQQKLLNQTIYQVSSLPEERKEPSNPSLSFQFLFTFPPHPYKHTNQQIHLLLTGPKQRIFPTPVCFSAI